MTRKRLPKAITQKGEDLQLTKVGGAASEEHEGPVNWGTSHPLLEEGFSQKSASPNSMAEAEGVPKRLPDQEVAALQPASPHRTAEAESASAIFLPPIAGELLPPVPIYAEPHAARRRAVAQKIVERYRLYAAVGGLFPVPVVNVAGVMAIITRMVKTLSNLYEVPFERGRTRSMVIGILGGAVPTGLGAATASTVALAGPGGGFVGLAVCSLTAAALTRGIGTIMVEHFETATRSPVVAKSVK
jgi:uncharacterized protein (DUF697 family)